MSGKIETKQNAKRKPQKIKGADTRRARQKIYDFYGVQNLRALKQQLGINNTLEVLTIGKEAYNKSLESPPPPPQYLASTTLPVRDSYGEIINDIQPLTTTNMNDYINDIKLWILDWFNRYKFTKTNKDMTFAFINGIKITPENIDTIDFTPFISMTPVVSAVDTTPILLSKPPKIQNCYNSDCILPTEINSTKLCAFNELLSGFRRKGCRNFNELIETATKCKEGIALYKTDNDGNLTRPPEKIEINHDNIISNGINTELLLKICTYLKIKCNIFQHLMNNDNFKLYRMTNDIPSEKKALNCYIKNNHLYLLKDISVTRQYNAIANNNNKGHNAKDKPINNFKGEIVLNTELKSIGDFLASVPIQPTSIKLNNNLLYPFIVEGIKYIYNYDKDLHAHFSDEYEGQTMPSIASSYIQTITPSFMNDIIFNELTADNVSHRTHADVLRPEYFNEDGLPIEGHNIQKYDLNKAYRHAMTNLKNIYTLDITNHIQKCDTLDGIGLYFVEPTTNNILHGNNWYSYDILNYALEQGEVFAIKLKLSVKKKANPFPDMINEICETFPNHISKQIINNMSGICGITNKKQVTAHLTRSENKVMDFLGKCNNPYVKYEPTLKQFLYGYKKLTKFNSNRLLTYIQILDQFNILLHQRIKDTGGQLLGRYIDAFYILNPTNEDHLSNEVGDYKPEAFKKIRQHTKERNVTPTFTELTIKQLNGECITDNRHLTLDHIKDGAMILGIGGTGKTHSIKRILESLETQTIKSISYSQVEYEHAKTGTATKTIKQSVDTICKKVEYLAPTNLASRILGGITLHNFFSIEFKTGLSNVGNSNLDYLVIDECSMITGEIWEVIELFKIKNPTTKIILLGDPHQLPSIENIQYNFNQVERILRLVNGNVCNLQKNYRQDKDGLAISTAIINQQNFYEWKNAPFNSNAKHITFLNSTRRKINSLYSTEGIRIKLNDPYPELDEDERQVYDESGNALMIDTYGHIKEGTKIICNDTHQLEDTKIFNGQTFIIKEIQDDNITTTTGTQIKKSVFSSHYTLNYAISVYKAQGQTFDCPLQIHDKYFMLKNYKFIYTAISRATHYKNISYFDWNFQLYPDPITELLNDAPTIIKENP